LFDPHTAQLISILIIVLLALTLVAQQHGLGLAQEPRSFGYAAPESLLVFLNLASVFLFAVPLLHAFAS
jgi:hypothetical protein